MSEAPERIWTTGTDKTGSWNYRRTLIRGPIQTEYVRADMLQEIFDRYSKAEADLIEELEAKNKRLNEQMDSIEEMGTESLNALPDCLMRLAPALVENDELKAKLAKAVEVFRVIEDASRLYASDRESDMENVRYAHECTRRLCVATLAELSSVSCANLKGETDE